MNTPVSRLTAVWINPDRVPDTFSCGCRTNANSNWPENPCYVFTFCELHAAAPALLKALQLLYLGVSGGQKPLINLDSEIAALARDAIKLAKGD